MQGYPREERRLGDWIYLQATARARRATARQDWVGAQKGWGVAGSLAPSLPGGGAPLMSALDTPFLFGSELG